MFYYFLLPISIISLTISSINGAATISAPIKQKVDLQKITDPLKKIEILQIGLTGANTQVFDGRDLIKNPPSPTEFGRWEQASKPAFALIQSELPQLEAVGSQLEKINQSLKDFFATVSRNKGTADASLATQYKQTVLRLQDQLKIVDNSLNAFESHYNNTLKEKEKKLKGITLFKKRAEKKSQKINTEKSTLVLVHVIIETFKANLKKILTKDLASVR